MQSKVDGSLKELSLEEVLLKGKNGFKEIKTAVENGGNITATVSGRNILHLAAHNKEIEMVEYLVAHYPALIKSPPSTFNFIYYLIFPPEMDSCTEGRKWFFNWFAQNAAEIQKEDSSLTQDHIDALLGKNIANWGNNALYGGLRPIHYAALVANPYCLPYLPALINEPLNNDFLQEISLSWILADNWQWQLLRQLSVDADKRIDLNQHLTGENYFSGTSLATILALHKQWSLIELLAAQEPIIDLNAGSKNIANGMYSMSILWLLIFFKEFDLLQKLLKKCPYPDFNATLQNPKRSDHGCSILYLLVANQQWDLIKEIIPKCQDLDLNNTPKNSKCHNFDKSVLFLLIQFAQWELISELIPKSKFIDLGAINQDKTIKYYLSYRKPELIAQIRAHNGNLRLPRYSGLSIFASDEQEIVKATAIDHNFAPSSFCPTP